MAGLLCALWLVFPSLHANAAMVHITEPTINESRETHEYTIIAWVPPNVVSDTDYAALELGANQSLFVDLNFSIASCGADLTAWAAGVETDIETDADRKYANAFLLRNTANDDPGPVINTHSWLSFPPWSYRLFSNFKASFPSTNGPIATPPSIAPGSAAYVGWSIDPCGTIFGFRLGSAPGEVASENGVTSFTPNGAYQINEGRIGSVGQAVSQTLNGHSVPFIWSTIEVDANNNLVSTSPQFHQIFPNYSIYKDGVRQYTDPASSLDAFISLDASSELLQSQVK